MSETNSPPVGGQSVIELSQTLGRRKRSQTIGKIGAALAKAQGEMQNAEKDVKGNFGKYATLAATWDAIRVALSTNEIAVYQRPLTIDGALKMCTMLIHSSGEFIDDGELEMIFDRTGGRLSPMQAMGSAVTYARRYTLQAATGVAPADDDDGEGAGKPQPPPQSAAQSKPKVTPKEPSAKPINNDAPASKKMIDRINELCIDRGVGETILHYVIGENGYGEKLNTVKHWQAIEIGNLLSNEDTTEVTLLAHAQKQKNKREADRILKEKNQGGEG